MDNAQKAIMIGVGLFITIIIIAAVMLITGMGQDLMNQGTQQLSQMSAQLQKQLTQDFDGTTKTGAEVLAAVKKYHGDSSMAIVVNNDKKNDVQAGGLVATRTGYVVNKLDANDSVAALASFSERTNATTYIVTTAQYTSNLLKQNDAVVGIIFEKK